LITEPNNTRRRELRLGEAGALPLSARDQFCLTAELNRPAYLYILWIDPDGDVWPAYPWEPGDWTKRPAEERTVQRLRRPEELDKTYRLPRGSSGMVTLVLLARETPLPADFDLLTALGKLPRQIEQDRRAAAWFENGQRVNDRPHRGDNPFNESRTDDPVLSTLQRISEKLQRPGHFSYSRAVTFATRGQ
jgi:hypothetical protein